MNRYQITGIIYIYISAWMSEWSVIHENFHTKYSVFTAPDEHMPYITQFQRERERERERSPAKKERRYALSAGCFALNRSENKWCLFLFCFPDAGLLDLCMQFKWGRPGAGGRCRPRWARGGPDVEAEAGVEFWPPDDQCLAEEAVHDFIFFLIHISTLYHVPCLPT